MYKQITTPAIILSRTNFNEVDRIVNFLGPKGQFSCMVKGARRPKSKLAGGIELFSVSQITYLDTNAELKSCLLYTSPSPRDRTRSRMPSSA